MSQVDTALVVKVAAGAFAVLAMTLAAVELGREQGGAARVASVASVPADAPPDALAAELARCRAITDPAAVDDGCRRAWAERRARFFGQDAEARP